ncbi:RluA family pseudouridine synthase [Bdellovibrio sp. HCB337]|uniref:RluA family pseudouridine synthase n=1 Tax=Bdellovibrio sp. HCB337 TaxID=3394358 RepID=UPI0039A6B2CF
MKKVPSKYQPRGFRILHEDLDVIVGNKAPGLLTVAAKWENENTVHNLLNQYVRKGNPRSNKCVYVVHRLDQATSGVLIFAKTEAVQQYLKNNWKSTIKTYYAIVHGHLAKKSGIISSYLSEDENYMVHSSEDADSGKLAETEYTVLKETPKFSLLKINLLTGKKNQIRVHMAEAGHPLVGDSKYGPDKQKFNDLRLHSSEIEFTHPHKKVRMSFKAPVPEYFKSLVAYEY